MKRLYDSVRWRKLAKWFLGRPENALCVMCAAIGRVEPATTVDHKIPHGGDERLFWDIGNLQGLCASCHSGWKRTQEKKGYGPAANVNGQPIDPGHPWNRTSPHGGR